MPFARPSLSDLITRIQGDLRGRLEVDGPLLRRAMIDVLGAVWAGAVHILYGYLDWLSKQLFADLSDDDQLVRQASLYGLTPDPALYATGTATVAGNSGDIIPSGTIVRLDAVTSYTVTASQTISAITGNADLPLQSVLAGSAANVPSGTVLTFESPIPGIQPTCTVDADITNGVDQETVDSLRARLLLRLQQPPEGGADQDYEAWALAAAGFVTRVWVYPNELGLGTVVVRFVEDNNLSSIFPDSGDVAIVQAAENAKRPITAAVTVEAPTNSAIAFSIHIVPSTTDTQAAVTAELADLFKREAEPGDGVSRGTILLSHILTAIGNAAGVTDYSMTVPSANIIPALGALPTVGTITWT